ncbi:unnamed protein product [Gongylonema pulchrum]|uniref:Uncharacterized protein n=1 Tax=Gongylonema pulchrum TaxID=637853 RepID=A0A183E7K6_9BILA|nr:unnamed protein product [Gongylonema pulchrum]
MTREKAVTIKRSAKATDNNGEGFASARSRTEKDLAAELAIPKVRILKPAEMRVISNILDFMGLLSEALLKSQFCCAGSCRPGQTTVCFTIIMPREKAVTIKRSAKATNNNGRGFASARSRTEEDLAVELAIPKVRILKPAEIRVISNIPDFMGLLGEALLKS